MVASNPTKRAHLSPDAIQAAVVEFAIQRFPRAVGLQQQFSKQFDRPKGAVALEKYSISRLYASRQDYNSAVARHRGFREVRKGLPPGMTNWEYYHLEHPPHLDTTRLQMHNLTELHVTKLVHGGTALQISLPSRVEKAASVERTHIHIGDPDQNVPGLVKIELKTAYDPSLVAVFANVDLRDEARVSLRACKFDFGDNMVEELAVDTLEWNGSNETVYQLGSGPLQSAVNLQDSVRPFFTNNGFIPQTDVVVETVNEVATRKIVVRHNGSPTWLQKVTAVKGGHEDQEIPAYPAGWCTLCRPVATQNQRPENLVEEVQTPPHVNRRTVLGNIIDRKRRYDSDDSMGSGHL